MPLCRLLDYSFLNAQCSWWQNLAQIFLLLMILRSQAAFPFRKTICSHSLHHKLSHTKETDEKPGNTLCSIQVVVLIIAKTQCATVSVTGKLNGFAPQKGERSYWEIQELFLLLFASRGVGAGHGQQRCLAHLGHILPSFTAAGRDVCPQDIPVALSCWNSCYRWCFKVFYSNPVLGLKKLSLPVFGAFRALVSRGDALGVKPTASPSYLNAQLWVAGGCSAAPWSHGGDFGVGTVHRGHGPARLTGQTPARTENHRAVLAGALLQPKPNIATVRTGFASSQRLFLTSFAVLLQVLILTPPKVFAALE